MRDFITRTLALDANGQSQSVVVRIPTSIERESSWECLWQIEWPDRTRTNLGAGVDGVQAVLLALSTAAKSIAPVD